VADVDHYGAELRAAAGRLAPFADRVWSSGSGPARFLFAERAGRAVELSRSGAGVWVEFWADDPETPAGEHTFGGWGKAVEAAVSWLRAGAGE
jgi:hypothetical protein